MPVYVYKNLRTGETFEVEQRITESAWTAHPDSGDPVKRLVQPVGIAFRGSGFYVTDSRSKGGSSGTSAAKGEGGSSEGSNSGEGKKDANKDGGGKADAKTSSGTGSSAGGSGASKGGGDK